jgi:hypothetical protein
MTLRKEVTHSKERTQEEQLDIKLRLKKMNWKVELLICNQLNKSGFPRPGIMIPK